MRSRAEDTSLKHFSVQSLGAQFGPTENDGLFRLLTCQQPIEDVVLQVLWDRHVELFDSIGRDTVLGEIDHLRAIHVSFGQLQNCVRQRRAQKQRLSLFWATAENFFDVGAETNVQHPVGFVHRG